MDAFIAAWVVRQYFSERGESCVFHAGFFYKDPPEVTDRDVILVDLSYSGAVLESLRDRARSVLVLDHHKTSIAELEHLPGDVNRCGARISWDYFCPDRQPPQTLYEFDTWERLMWSAPEELARDGVAIERRHSKDVNELIGAVSRRMTIGGYTVPVANLPYTHLAAAHALCRDEAFAGCYWDTETGRVFDLRSNDAGIDVSEIAKLYGGGGHRNAAGFTVDFALARTFELNGT